MTPAEIDAALDAAAAAVSASDPDLLGTGYWRAVASVKRDRSLIEPYADRIGAIDQALFRSRVPIVVPFWPGMLLAVLGSLVSLLLVGLAYGADDPWNGIVFLAGLIGLLVATHSLGHLAVGSAVGIRFTAWFAFFRRPQPGVKTDYASYLRVPARHRAWMHASGAIVTKAIPFLLIPAALTAGIPVWATVALVVVAIAQLVTDAVWSTKASDWSKFRREMDIARRYEGA
jgi:hypothetical protein